MLVKQRANKRLQIKAMEQFLIDNETEALKSLEKVSYESNGSNELTCPVLLVPVYGSRF